MDSPRSLAGSVAPRLGAARFNAMNLALLGVVVIWGVNFSVAKASLSEMSPLAFNGLRFLLAFPIMLLLTRAIDGNVRIERADLPRLVLAGLVGHTIYQRLFIVGLDHTQAGHSSLMLGLTPVFVALISLALGVERIRPAVWVGILLSFAGIVLITSGSNSGIHLGGPTLVGDLLTVAGTICWATYTVLSKPLLARYSPLKFTAVTMALGAIPLVAISLPSMAAQDWSRVTRSGWLGILYSFSLAILFGYAVWYTSVQRVGTARTAVLSNLTPVVALLTAWLVLGETLAPVQLAGALVVLAGISLARRKS